MKATGNRNTMGHVVFLRAANVGGKNVFRPAQLARSLDHLDVVNVGAAGTFVVRGKASAARIRREILARLPFEPSLAVVPAREVVALVRSDPFAGVRFSKDRRGWVAVLDSRPRPLPAATRGLRLSEPRGGEGARRPGYHPLVGDRRAHRQARPDRVGRLG